MGVKNQNIQDIIMLCIFFLFILITCFQSVLADNYYADITIDVNNSGFVTIEGITNHPDLLAENTELYTSKKQSYWLLNITKDEIFSDFVYVVTLPERASINYVKSSGYIRIEEDLGSLTVKGFGQNKTFSVIVQYQIGKPLEDESSILTDQTFLFLIIGIIFVLIIVVIFFKRSSDSKKSEKTIDNNKEYNPKGLNERQKKIMKLLIERDIPLTQTDIQKELKIPKAAVSRNIRSLELKGLIEKEQIGMSNLIRIKKP